VDDERTLRRARRVIWTFRLIFYPGALIVVLSLLGVRSESQSQVLTGTTGQGRR
jgi:hypothetical protein